MSKYNNFNILYVSQIIITCTNSTYEKTHLAVLYDMTW